MARARELLHAGRGAEAARVLEPLAAAEPRDEELTVLRGRALVFGHPAQAEQLVAAVPPASAWADGADLVRTLAGAFQADPQRPSLSAGPLRDRYLAALAYLQREEFDAGLAALIDVLLEKPAFDAQRARDVARGIFRHLGLYADPARDLGTVLPDDVLPASFFVDRDGNVISFLRSYVDWDDPRVDAYVAGLGGG